MHPVVAGVTAITQGNYKAVFVSYFSIGSTIKAMVYALFWSATNKAAFHIIGYN